MYMKELDLLKKDWQKSEGSFEQLSEKDIYAMIHKKSSSIVKWILIVSILEFVILNGIGLLLPEDHSNEFNDKFDFYINILEIFSYGITIYFVFLFFKNYKSISVISSTKELAESILKTRKTVKYYIRYNISYIILIMISFVAYTIYTDFITKNDFSSEMTIAIVGLLFLSAIIIALMWGFYQLIYGFLLKKLKRNYEELQKIE
jgi:hypothetical protein